MGNRTSSQQQGPPPLLSAAVTGNLEAFTTHWNDATTAQRLIKDRQDNNVLHALFSCRCRPSTSTSASASPFLPSSNNRTTTDVAGVSTQPTDGANASCRQILTVIHESLTDAQLVALYRARNALGCTALWILVAYGNVPLLRHVVVMTTTTSIDRNNLPLFDDGNDDLSEMLLQSPNRQGDSPLLATCSQGNLAMVRYLHENANGGDGAALWTLDQFAAALRRPNRQGTTVLSIVVANGHESMLQYLLNTAAPDDVVEDELYAVNAATGLSLFHVCAERNFHAGLRLLLLSTSKTTTASDGNKVTAECLQKALSLHDKNRANALHVASYCGNLEIVTAWIELLRQAHYDDDQVAALLDRPDGQGRTAYWIAGLQGHVAVQEALAAAGVQTTEPPRMVQEIRAATERRSAARRDKRAVDGNALLGGGGLD